MIYGRHYGTGELIGVEIQHGNISAIRSQSQLESHILDKRLTLPYLAPGLIDLQINGYGGEDFNQLPLTEQSILSFCKHMWRLGVTKFYPTLITNSQQAIRDSLQLIAYVCDQYDEVNASIAGIHLEGPFISPLDGARGAHDKQFVCAPNVEWLKDWQNASGNRIKIITLSPEWEESSHFIKYCKEQGIVASIGHTAATSEQIKEAAQAGASMITHFGNGVQLQLPRHPNFLWEQLAQDQLYACLIADSYHLPHQVLKIAYKVKGNRAILVSDAVALSGSQPGAYTTFVGGDVILTEKGKLHLAHNDQLLAGSVSSLKEGVQHMYGSGIASFEEAWNMASLNPATLLRLTNRAGLTIGAPADFVQFNYDHGSIVIAATYVNGECLYRR